MSGCIFNPLIHLSDSVDVPDSFFPMLSSVEVVRNAKEIFVLVVTKSDVVELCMSQSAPNNLAKGKNTRYIRAASLVASFLPQSKNY